jgi:hypothetical protein
MVAIFADEAEADFGAATYLKDWVDAATLQGCRVA